MYTIENSSSNMLVSPMQQYIQNIGTATKPMFIQEARPTQHFSSSLPASSMFYYGRHQISPASPPNTQTLFSDNYFNLIHKPQQNPSYSNGYVTNTVFDPINQSTATAMHHRPITKRLTVKTSPMHIQQQQQSSSSQSVSPASFTPFTASSFSPSSFSSCSRRDSINSNCSSNKANQKSLPVRSQAVDMTAHIENAKKLKEACNKKLYCTFCKNNGESEEIYSSHLLKDSTGRVQCPVLKLHVCPICGESGEKAHTITYCKEFKKSKRVQMMENAIRKMNF